MARSFITHCYHPILNYILAKKAVLSHKEQTECILFENPFKANYNIKGY